MCKSHMDHLTYWKERLYTEAYFSTAFVMITEKKMAGPPRRNFTDTSAFEAKIRRKSHASVRFKVTWII